MFKKKVCGMVLTQKAFVNFLTLSIFLIGGFLVPWMFLVPIHMSQDQIFWV